MSHLNLSLASALVLDDEGFQLLSLVVQRWSFHLMPQPLRNYHVPLHFLCKVFFLVFFLALGCQPAIKKVLPVLVLDIWLAGLYLFYSYWQRVHSQWGLSACKVLKLLDA